jgi:peptidyl-Lys metalloendopeptidase
MDSFKLRFTFLIIVLISLGPIGSSAYSGALRYEGLKVEIEQVSYSPSEYGVIKVRFVYTNVSDGALRFLKSGTALEGGIFEDLLSVDVGGESLPYIGPTLKRLAPRRIDYVSLAVGESLQSVVEIQRAYDFSRIGEYKLRPRQLAYTKESVIPNTLRITVVQPPREFKRPPNFLSCDASQQSQLDSALDFSELYAATARNALASTPLDNRATARRYSTWFGAYDSTRWDRVQTNFVKIADGFANKTVEFNCLCDDPDTDQTNIVAYVYKSRPYEINLCPIFWRLRRDGVGSKAGVLVHEMSHFSIVANADDHVYGQTAARDLARRDPAQAISNADSYELFAENPGNLTMAPPRVDEPIDVDPPTVESIPLEPAPANTYLSTIINYLLEGDGELPPGAAGFGSPRPALPQPSIGKFNAAFSLSGSFAEGAARKYQYSPLNSNYQIRTYSDGGRLLIDLQGFGVTSDDRKTSDSWSIVLHAGYRGKFRPGIYRNLEGEAYSEAGNLEIELNRNELQCESGTPRRQIRVFEIAFTDNILSQLLADLELKCDGTNGALLRASIDYNATADDPVVDHRAADQSLLLPPLPMLDFGGISYSVIQDNIDGGRAPSYFSNSGANTRIRNYSNIPGELRFVVFTPDTQLQIHYKPPELDIDPIVTGEQFLGHHQYLLGRSSYGNPPNGQFEVLLAGQECLAPVSDVTIFDLAYTGQYRHTLDRLVMQFITLCQETGERYRGSIRINFELDSASYSGPDPIDGSLYPSVPEPTESGANIVFENSNGELISMSSVTTVVDVEETDGHTLSIGAGGSEGMHIEFQPKVDLSSGEILTRLQVGSYKYTTASQTNDFNALHRLRFGKRHPSQSSPTLCSTDGSTSDANIYQVEYDAAGTLVKLVADFHADGCGRYGYMVRAGIRYDITLPKIFADTPSEVSADQTFDSTQFDSKNAQTTLQVGSNINQWFALVDSNIVVETLDGERGFSVQTTGRNQYNRLEFARANLAQDRNREDRLTSGVYQLEPKLDASVFWFRARGGDGSVYGPTNHACDGDIDAAELTIHSIEYTGTGNELSIIKLHAEAEFTCISRYSRKQYVWAVEYDHSLDYVEGFPSPVQGSLSPQPSTDPSSNFFVLKVDDANENLAFEVDTGSADLGIEVVAAESSAASSAFTIHFEHDGLQSSVMLEAPQLTINGDQTRFFHQGQYPINSSYLHSYFTRVSINSSNLTNTRCNLYRYGEGLLRVHHVEYSDSNIPIAMTADISIKCYSKIYQLSFSYSDLTLH